MLSDESALGITASSALTDPAPAPPLSASCAAPPAPLLPCLAAAAAAACRASHKKASMERNMMKVTTRKYSMTVKSGSFLAPCTIASALISALLRPRPIRNDDV